MFRFASNLKKKGLPVESKTWQVAYEDLEFFKTLGEGNFGTVFHGTYFGTDVAIKKINDDEQKYLDREVMILKSIRHPNIVQLMGVCEHSSGLYLVTELLPGGTLRKKLKNPAVEIPWPTRINICIDLARALTFLHSKEIIHRDLKSKNVLLDDHFKVKICDFGLARTMEMDGVPRRMTMCGTDDWMAPEIAAGNPYTELSDVFSFGVILLEVIFRQKPNQDAIRKSLLYGVDVRTVIERKPKDVPDRLFDVATRACAMDWASRPQMANCLQELKVTLTEYTAAEASKAPSTPQQTPNAAPLSPRSSAAIHHTPPPPSYPSSSLPSLSIATTAPSTPQQTSNAAPLSPRSSAAPAPPPLPKSAPPPPPPPPSHITPKPPHATSAATSSSTTPSSSSSSDPSDLTDEKLIEYALTSSIRRRSTIGNHHEHLILALQQSSQEQQQQQMQQQQQQPMQQTKPSNAPTRPGGPPPKPPPPKPSGPPPNAPPNQGPISPPGRDKILHADRPGQSFRVGGQGPNSFEIFVNPLVGQRGTIDASDLKTFDEPDQSGSSGNRSKDQKPSLAHKLFGKSG